jgi:subtilisin family serine protease
MTLMEIAHAEQRDRNSEFKTDKVSHLLKGKKHGADEMVTVIVRLNGSSTHRLDALIKQTRVHKRKVMKNLRSLSLSVPFSMVGELASLPEVSHISSNEAVRGFGHVSLTTGVDAGQAAALAAGRGVIDGSGVGIAILDSGIDLNHAQFAATGNGARVIASVDFTGENRTDDPYGHGTFVAAAAAGGAGAGADYTGIAPGASLLNVRVLNSAGEGSVETVMAGLDWVASHARQYNIRIVNMSLGSQAIESYKYDALCRAVRGLVNSGVLVFVAAGNDGKDSSGQKVYGAIHSPGIEPSAFTIGASNSFQTDGRLDDGVATFSSRGPTRSYWVDGDGVTHHDNLLKPDLTAPGNKLVFAQAHDNLLVTSNPTLNASSSGTGATMKMMRMSGTSVSTPIAAGAAALMLQINPRLTPNMVKAFLEYTAQKLNGFGTLEQGAGQLNIEGAIRLALSTRGDLTSPAQVGQPLLTGSVTTSSSFADSTFTWGGTIIRKFNTMSGIGLITRLQGPYCSGELLGDGFLLSDGVIINRGALPESNRLPTVILFGPVTVSFPMA